MIAARALNAAHEGVDRAATVLLVAADWCSRTAWRLDPDPAFDDVTWLDEPPLVPRPDRDGWPLDPDGYHVDGTHYTEDTQ